MGGCRRGHLLPTNGVPWWLSSAPKKKGSESSKAVLPHCAACNLSHVPRNSCSVGSLALGWFCFVVIATASVAGTATLSVCMADGWTSEMVRDVKAKGRVFSSPEYIALSRRVSLGK